MRLRGGNLIRTFRFGKAAPNPADPHWKTTSSPTKNR